DLYIAVEAFDDHIEELHATEQREDRFFEGDDFVQIHLDPRHNHRTKYGFFSNPLGTRLDGAEGFSGSSWTTGWSAEWELAARILEDRWVFEMRIPFGVMNYRRADGQTWGINFTRRIPRLDSYSFWSFNPTDPFRPHNFGHLTHLDLAETQFDRNLEVSPYVSTRVDFNGASEAHFEAGIDTSFRLSPSVITALTLNPDFGQVEADADTIELRDTERFLPERRLFFREGAEIFQMRHRLYYSRRFTDILTGAKISGEMNKLNFAFLNIQGDTQHGGTRNGNSSVLRAVQHVQNKSSIGYYLNASEFEDGHSRVASTDGYFFLTDEWRLSYQASVADDRLTPESGVPGKDRVDYLGFGALSYESYPWYFTLSYDAITEGFDPNLGLIFRRDIFGPTFEAAYRHDSDERWYKRLDVAFDASRYQDEEGKTVLRDYLIASRAVFPNDLGVSLSHADEFHAPYNNHRTSGRLSFNTSDLWRSVDVGWAGGVFQEVDYNELSFGKPYKPFERLPIRYELNLRFEELPTGGDNLAWLNRIVFDYFITDDMWLKSSLQHRDDSIHNISVIYGWKIRPDLQWYLVYNSVADDDDTRNSAFTKLVYTFN
ncbi:MAG TPA: hypothetical protein DCY13_23050, partial [Verrucomicrobiales bacterium]|nr:hypothetical protein [Verrucomicrobiales bacterium]